MDKSRRDFLKIAGGVLGGVVLSQCSGSSESKGPPLPSGYRFHRLFTTGNSLPGAGEALYIPPSVKISDSNQIIFHAGDAVKRTDETLNMGLYELLMDYGSSEPRVSGRRKVIRVGDRLDDGREVFRVTLADVNHRGSVVVRLHTRGEPSHSLYMAPSAGNSQGVGVLRRLMGFKTPTPDGENVFGASMGNFDLHDDDDVLVSSFWASKKGSVGGESVFHLAGGVVDSRGSILLTTGDMLPEAPQTISKFGLLHGHRSGGDYAVQVHTDPVFGSAGNGAPEAGSAVLKGMVRGTGARTTLVAASADIAARAAARSARALPTGKIHFGPRINATGDVAIVTHVTDDAVRLTAGEGLIASSGDLTPAGKVIAGIGGPVMGADGLIFFVAGTTDKAEELLVSNGSRTTSLLSTGMRPFGVTGPRLLTMAFGYAREQVDSHGRLVFVGEFDDNTLSVVLGIPL